MYVKNKYNTVTTNLKNIFQHDYSALYLSITHDLLKL